MNFFNISGDFVTKFNPRYRQVFYVNSTEQASKQE